jgi:hypothetical protein
MLVSSDLNKWPSTPTVLFEGNDARDACIQLFNGIYHWYYCQWQTVDGVGRSCIRLRKSTDLVHWSEPVDVHIDTSREVQHSHLESPFVISEAGCYWLFVRNRSLEERSVTTVFMSNIPDKFASGINVWNFELEFVHAPELVKVSDKWMIARVSGVYNDNAYAPIHGGWVDIAQISFI